MSVTDSAAPTIPEVALRPQTVQSSKPFGSESRTVAKNKVFSSGSNAVSDTGLALSCLCCAGCECSTGEPTTTAKIIEAADSGDLHYIRHAVCALRDSIMDMTDEDGRTALHVASLRGHLPILKFLLLSVGNKRERRDEQLPYTAEGSMTPSSTSTTVSSAPTAAEGSASIDTQDVSFEDAWAVGSTSASTVSNEQKSALASQLANQLKGMVGRDTTTERPSLWASRVSKRGHTALHWAAVKGHTSCVEVLLDYGFDVNATSSQSASPLQLAVAAERPDAVRLLVRHRADVNLTTLSGSYPAKVSAYLGNLAIVDALRGEENSTLTYF